MAGSWDISAAIAANARSGQAVFLFPQPASGIFDPERDAPAIVWFVFDQVAARLPPDYDVGVVDAYQEAFPELPVFVVAPGEQLPSELPAERFTRSGTVVDDLVVWEESLSERPDDEVRMQWGLSVWRLTGPPSQPAPA
jgi:hypothetical protein